MKSPFQRTMTAAFQTTGRLLTQFGQRTFTKLICGFLSGMLFTAWFHQYAATFGTDLPASHGVLVVLLLAFFVSRVSLDTRNLKRTWAGTSIAEGFCHFLLIMWAVLFPEILHAASRLIGWFTIEQVAQPAIQYGLFFLIGGFAFLVPFWAMFRLSDAFDDGGSSTGEFYVGTAIGVLISVFATGPLVGAQWTALIAALGSCAVMIVASFSRTSRLTQESATKGERKADDPKVNGSFISSQIQIVCFGLSIGGFTAVVVRAAHQLMPATNWVIATEWAALQGSLGLGLIWGRSWLKNDSSSRRRTYIATVFALVAPLVITLAFRQLVYATLLINSQISNIQAAMAAKSLLLALFFAPLGLAFGLVWTIHAAWPPQEESQAGKPSPLKDLWTNAAKLREVRLLSAFVAGFVMAQSVGLSGLGVVWLAIVVAVPVVAIHFAPQNWDSTTPRNRQLGFRVAFASAIACLFLVANRTYDPALAARLLFNSQIATAFRQEMRFEELPFLDEGKCIAISEGTRGTYTSWLHRGVQMQLRASGIPMGIHSLNSDLVPQYSGEIMRAVVPLVLHEQAQRVLVLGSGSGSSLETCLAFPIQHVTYVCEEERLIEHVNNAGEGASHLTTHQSRDSRVQFVIIDPTVAVNAQGNLYDVIISQAGQHALLRGASYTTSEYYESCANQLSESGIFVQPLSLADFGPKSSLRALATFREQFSDVMAIAVAPYEVLLLGTNSTAGLIRDGLARRASAEHVRRIQGQLGWDWSVVFNLPMFDNVALDVLAGAEPFAPSTTRDCTPTFTLPREALRWANKVSEFNEMFGPRAGKLLLKLAAEEHRNEIQLRLNRVIEQQRVMAEFPDQWWAYRKVLRHNLTTQARAEIRQVSGQSEESLHPEEQRRLDYLAMLGDAAERPSITSLDRLERFESPYDPLVSEFLHHEVANIIQRASISMPEREFRHLLHTIFYSPPNDRSVRNVVRAIELLVENEETAANAEARQQFIDALLQVLKQRWDARRQVEPRTADVLLNDIDLSIAAVESSLAVTETWISTVPSQAKLWNGRKAYLEKSLLRPLRTYRTQIVAHETKSRAKAKQVRDRMGETY